MVPLVSLCYRPMLETLEDRTLPASGIPSTWVQLGSGGGGALFSPSFNPADTGEFYVASDMSQVFRSTNGGLTYQMVPHQQLQGGHYSQLQFTSTPGLRYSLDYTNDVTSPKKSIDSGTTWTSITDPTGGGAYKLSVDPSNGQRLLINNYSTIYASLNGGSSWTQVYTTANGSGVHIGGVFWDGSNVYVGTSRGLLTSSNGLTSALTTSSVGGIASTEAILGFSGAKEGATVRLFAVTAPQGDVFNGLQYWDGIGTPNNAYTLDVGQASWTQRTTGLPNSGTFALWFAATASNNINVAYIAGMRNSEPAVYKTTDGGVTWSSVFNTTANGNIFTGWQGAGGDRQWSYGEAALGFTVAPNDPNRLIITDYGYAHLSVDGGATWRQTYTYPEDQHPMGQNTPQGDTYRSSGLDNTTSWQVAWANTNTLMIANSDIRGQRSTDGGKSWGFGYTGHSQNSMYRVVQSNSVLYAATSTVHDLYTWSRYISDSDINAGDGEVKYSTNAGATWQTLHDFNAVVAWVALDPNNANRLYASVAESNTSIGGIWVSSNINLGASSTWTKLAIPARASAHPFNVVVLNDGTLVCTYSARTVGGTFQATSGVFVSTDSGTTWADRTHADMQYWTMDVVIDPHDASQNTWYAGARLGWNAASGKGGLFKSTNRGISWTKLGTFNNVTSITINPTDQNEAWVTTELSGLWYSNNIRAATPTFTQVANYTFRHPTRVFYNPSNTSEIWVTSYGGGVHRGVLGTTPTVVSTQIDNGQAQRSMVRQLVVTFNSIVNLGPGAFELRPQGGGQLKVTSFTTQTVSNQTIATITWTGGSLTDGRWTLKTVAGQVTDTTSSAALAADRTDNFFRLIGDANGDAIVNASDLTLFRAALGSTSGQLAYRDYFDFNGDGQINAFDFTIMRANLGRTV